MPVLSMDKPKVVNLPDPDKLAADLERMKRNLPGTEEYLRLLARLHKAKYDALIEAGFTPDQALELCKVLIQK